MLTQSVQAKFWERVSKGKPDECWPWRAGRRKFGYGLLYVKDRPVPAARIAWMIANGVTQWPEGKIACHTCDNPPCVNAAHIWAGTIGENARDRNAKGRHFIRKSDPNRMCKYDILCEINCTKCGHYRSDDYIESSGRRRCRPCEIGRAKARRHPLSKPPAGRATLSGAPA